MSSPRKELFCARWGERTGARVVHGVGGSFDILAGITRRAPLWWQKPMLTRDQVRLLKRDNVVAPDVLTLADLGIEPETVEAIIPTYLWRFRREGQFESPPRLPANASQ